MAFLSLRLLYQFKGGVFMFYLGIDIGKNNHVASLIDDKGKPVFKAFSFTNSTVGANSLLDKISNFKELEIGLLACPIQFSH